MYQFRDVKKVFYQHLAGEFTALQWDRSEFGKSRRLRGLSGPSGSGKTHPERLNIIVLVTLLQKENWIWSLPVDQSVSLM